MIVLHTSAGDITIELDKTNAPISSANFVEYAKKGHYDGTIFHRIIDNFMIQGGGYTPGPKLKEPSAHIFNESGNGLRNLRGTIAMARSNEPHTAKAQFFINVKNNNSLNPEKDHWGFTVFGVVIEGLEIVDLIANVRTGSRGELSEDVPNVPILINKASRYEFE